MGARGTARVVLIGGLGLALVGCAEHDAYRQAFSAATAVVGNTRIVRADADHATRAVEETLAAQGFTIAASGESGRGGIVSARREMQDPHAAAYSYLVESTVTVNEFADRTTRLTVAANQQTILHQKYHTWWHLLWLVPIFPTGTVYNTVVRRASTIQDPTFYHDFFVALDKELGSMPAAAMHSAGQATNGAAAGVKSLLRTGDQEDRERGLENSGAVPTAGLAGGANPDR